MKTKNLGLILLLILVFPALFVGCANGQQAFEETIKKPVLGDVISGGTVDLQFSLAGDHFWPMQFAYKVYFDGNLYFENQRTFNNGWRSLIEEQVPLSFSNLTQGRHTVRVDVSLDWTEMVLSLPEPLTGTSETSESVDFYIYKGIQPQVSISGSDVFSTGQIAFNVSTNEAGSTVAYSVDGSANLILLENQSVKVKDAYVYNVTLLGLSNGDHTLTVYTKDVFNSTATAEKAFTVDQPLVASSVAAITGAVIAVVVIVGVAILLLKRRSKKSVLVKG